MNMEKPIPVFINNRNRLSTTRKLVEWLAKLQTPVHIIIVDNASSYPDLLDYYQSLSGKIEVIRLENNIGPYAPWITGLVDEYTNDEDFYVVTDSDILPIDECPLDMLNNYKVVLDKYPQVNKVGPGLNIFDLPDHYKLKWLAIKLELEWWRKPIDDVLYQARIDTTFALYKKGVSIPYIRVAHDLQGDGYNRPKGFLRAARSGYPYIARHMVWYEDSENLTEEEAYIKEHSTFLTFWTGRG